jgi:hypothetical protein
MANNGFRIAGSFFVSKAGYDTNDGGRDTPWLTLNKAIENGAGVLGAGSYLAPTAGMNPYTGASWTADGLVKVIGDGATRNTQIGGSQYCVYTGIYYDKFGGFGFHGVYSGVNTYNRCIFKVVSENASADNSSGQFPGGNDEYTNCIFVNINGGGNWKFTNCLFFNCTITQSNLLKQCYLDPTTSVVTAEASQCNVDKRAQPASQQGIRIAGGGFGLATPGGISELPGFNSLAKEDWSLLRSSPHISLGIGPDYLRFANTLFVESTGTTGDVCTVLNTQFRFASSQQVVRLLSISGAPDALLFNAQGGLVRKPDSNGNGFSQLVTRRVNYSDISQEVTGIRMFAGLNFDTDYPTLQSQILLANPSVFNNNVVTFGNGASQTARRNPNRLTYRMRWSTLVDPDEANPDHWVSGTKWIEFEWNTKPVWNQGQQLGNGNPDFSPTGSGNTNVVARWLQLEITIRDDYFSH